MRYRYNYAARLELFDATLFYEQKREGLGSEFIDEVESGIATILEAPGRWPQMTPGIHRYRLRRFPYGVIYRVVDQMLEVIALADLRRNPDYWRDRLPNQ